MCGICGVWEYGATRGGVERSLIERMRDEMTHRGPDDSGELIFDDGRGGLGFRRLSIIDLTEAGHQPMHGCADDLWLVFNGEIYNHASLREGLEQRGHIYASRTDSETILHLYEERGLDFVHDIEGDYAIALWDSQRERLVLVRDRVGVKPLYFYQQRGRFIFASEIKAILQHPAVTADVDEESLYHYLTFMTTPAPRTLFSDIKKLPAGHMLVLCRDGEVNISRYWDALPPAEQASASVSEEEHHAEILRLLRDSIKKRMMSDVPFGVFLSGGVDSSTNVALMAEQMSRPVETFTVGFRDQEYLNELDSARKIAETFGTNHHEIIIDERDALRFLPDLVFHQDEPIADPVCVPLYYVSKLARDSGTIVVQVGEGADEIFSGYANYVHHLQLYERFWQHAEKIPLAMRHAASRVARPLLEATGKKRMMIELIRRLGADEPLFWGGVVIYDEAMKPRALSPSMRARWQGRSSLEVVNSYLEHIERERPNSDFLTRMIYLELKLRLPELLLMRVDKITMATSVEARVPFLDHHLVEYAMGLPRILKVEGASGKHILKRALEQILPHDLLYSRKRGFGAPVREWFRTPLGQWLDEHLLDSPMRRRDFFDYKFIARLVDEHRRGTHDWSQHLWGLLNLSLWYERWIDRG
ncbi:MAG TPA: asparagine synthase (glutamine-hydrolyzing) [Pyrinomonadaceae bacterium]|nr:asparagine synthase (glutamine-hydrolyzing) [Pyrinomonadaceae bacterium]